MYYNLIFADVAQLAVQLICNQQVAGSIPVVGSTLYMGSSSRGRISNIVSYESKNGMHEPV